jgi:hypothetical protein
MLSGLNEYQYDLLKYQLTEETPILIQQINAGELKTIFDDDALTTFLFPSGYMVVFVVYYSWFVIGQCCNFHGINSTVEIS